MHTPRHLLWLLATSLLLFACSEGSNTFDPTGYENSHSGIRNDNANPTTRAEYSRLEMPHIKGDALNLVVVHTTSNKDVNYILEWDCMKKSQRWSCYTLHRANSPKNVSRWYASKGESQYPKDPDIPSQYMFADDPYYGSGYDHGHILPSYDRLNSREANIQTFYLSNMQHQRKKFNAGLWLKMENMVSSTWNTNAFRDTLYVCKGGTIDQPSQILGTMKNGLIVPRYFFMAILCKNSQGYKALGFWVEHLNEDRSGDNIINYVVSIDELEQKTGIDFFCNLPDDVEETTEKVVYPVAWSLRQ